MSKRYPGGIITKSPATPTGPFETGTAPGIWTLEQQMQFKQQGVWPLAGNVPNFIEDVFSCFLYTGTSATQTITNGIDLSTKGGLVWIKSRSNAAGHRLVDTVRGATKALASSSTDAQFTEATGLTAFNSAGFTLGDNSDYNSIGENYVSWTFREQPKFFDVVTYTGTGSNTTIAHSLGSVPGSIIVKRTDTTADWAVYHRSLANTQYLVLNTTAAAATGATWWNSTTPTSSVFSVGTDASVNASGGTYVAYVFAHDAGGFGLTGTDNAISCGSIAVDASGNGSANLGYEPQWVLAKDTNNTQNWLIFDTMRVFPAAVSSGPNAVRLSPNTANAESAFGQVGPTATGWGTSIGQLNASSTYIYIAIRRGPMKVPTLGTSVFSTSISSADTGVITSGFVTDMAFTLDRTSSGVTPFDRAAVDRLRNSFRNLSTATTAAEVNNTSTVSFQQNNGIYLNGGTVYLNGYVYEQFGRAPGYFDVVCYTGTGSATTFSHNLAVVPEMMIVKSRSTTGNWQVFHKDLNALGTEPADDSRIRLNSDAAATANNVIWNSTLPTSAVFSVGASSDSNGSGVTFVNYLFATCAGVSKVGSYTGTGTTQTINCGFTAGSRFVLIKRADDVGDWYVWDSARGIIAGNDPYLLLNTTAAEVTGTDYIDTANSGFEISSTAPAAINANAGTFIFLAIA